MTREERIVLSRFNYGHLPKEKQATSRKFHDLALELMQDLPEHPDRVRVLRRLVKVKDIAVRCKLPLPPEDA